MTTAAVNAPSRSGVMAAFLAVYVLWGSTYLAIKFAVETLPPLMLAGTRFTFAGLIMYALARLWGNPAPQWRYWPAAASVGVLLVAANGGVSWAERIVPSGMAALLVTAVPLWMVLLNWLRPRGARPSFGQGIGLIIGFIGVVVLINPFRQSELLSAHSVDLLGAFVLVMASLSWAIGSLRSRHVKLPASPWISTGMEMLTGGLAVLAVGLLMGEAGEVDLAAISAKSLLAMAYLIVFGSLIGFTCYVWIMRVSTPARVGTYAYVNPVVAVLLGYSVAGETITGWTLFAAAIIVFAVVLITSSRPETSTAPAESAKPAPAAQALAAAASGAARGGSHILAQRDLPRLDLAADTFSIPELERAREVAGRAFFEFLRKESMSAGLYYLPAGGVDTQSPHGEDEVYVILSGRAHVLVGGEDREVAPGTIVYVEAGVDHRFHDLTDDLTALVFFAPAEGTQALRFREMATTACDEL